MASRNCRGDVAGNPISLPHEPALMKLPTFFRRRRHLLLSLVLTAVAVPLALEAVESRAQPVDGTQTLVFLRHAEKPGEGLGQLNCQGLNRALDLATLLPDMRVLVLGCGSAAVGPGDVLACAREEAGTGN